MTELFVPNMDSKPGPSASAVELAKRWVLVALAQTPDH